MSAYKLAIYDLFLELLSFKTNFRTRPIDETDATKMKKVRNFSFVMKKKFSPSSRWWLNFFFSFFKNSVLKTHFLMMALRMISFFCQMSVWIFRGLFLFVFCFSKQKSDFFLCYREFWPLCSVVFFFSLGLWFGYFVVTSWGRLSGLNAWKNFQTFNHFDSLHL